MYFLRNKVYLFIIIIKKSTVKLIFYKLFPNICILEYFCIMRNFNKLILFNKIYFNCFIINDILIYSTVYINCFYLTKLNKKYIHAH